MRHDCDSTLGAFALACGLLLGACQATPRQEQAPQPPPSMEEMMQKMMEVGTPGPEHAELARMAGEWEQTYKHRMSPDMPWSEFKGTSRARTILGGRFVIEEFDMNMEWEGKPFPMQGFNLLGYDKLHKEYISLWTDSMSTWWVTSRGKQAADGTSVMTGTMADVTGERPFRIVIKHKDADTIEMEMYDTIAPHGELLVMTSVSKRKK